MSGDRNLCLKNQTIGMSVTDVGTHRESKICQREGARERIHSRTWSMDRNFFKSGNTMNGTTTALFLLPLFLPSPHLPSRNVSLPFTLSLSLPFFHSPSLSLSPWSRTIHLMGQNISYSYSRKKGSHRRNIRRVHLLAGWQDVTASGTIDRKAFRVQVKFLPFQLTHGSNESGAWCKPQTFLEEENFCFDFQYNEEFHSIKKRPEYNE